MDAVAWQVEVVNGLAYLRTKDGTLEIVDVHELSLIHISEPTRPY